ncbi:Major Facilitator Superfamily protein [Aspergillus niger]|uniref:Major Facilitator Superfamily protein n=1 Tax=Aspergillus niger TaxID=5061 RepID=A0A505IKK8_ASPNG|nr:Major Facilitator Superfamily protein [Aspergillus niger]
MSAPPIDRIVWLGYTSPTLLSRGMCKVKRWRSCLFHLSISNPLQQ